MLALNEILQGRYRIVRQIGQGGMGSVYEAEDNKRFNKAVALKEILIETSHAASHLQQEMLKRAFEREAKLLTRLDHEAFPQVVDFFVERENQYLVMELIQGDDLDKQLKKRGKPFSVAEVLQIAQQLLDALDYLHTLDPAIIHRDIKPHNLKLTSRGKLKLLDFGIAKGSDVQLSSTLTNQTFIAATLNYSPFEQVFRVLDENYREFITEKYPDKSNTELALRIDSRSDIYSLGATLYHLLTGELPVDSLKRSLEIWAGRKDPLRRPEEINNLALVGISDWIIKAVEVERANRFNNAKEMQEALTQLLADSPSRQQDGQTQQGYDPQSTLQNNSQQVTERLLVESADTERSPTNSHPIASPIVSEPVPKTQPVASGQSVSSIRPLHTSNLKGDTYIVGETDVVEISNQSYPLRPKQSRAGLIAGLALTVLVSVTGFGIYSFVESPQSASPEPANTITTDQPNNIEYSPSSNAVIDSNTSSQESIAESSAALKPSENVNPKPKINKAVRPSAAAEPNPVSNRVKAAKKPQRKKSDPDCIFNDDCK